MTSKRDPSNIRNIAIVAHIDHGKTTLVDALLRQSNVFREGEEVVERVMDSYDQEKERGITIFSKPASIYYEDVKINLIDTPGHSDFSAEVERVLGMVGSVLLVVDAQEGPMPQTRFVLSKALQKGLKPIVVVNKIDRPAAAPDRALDLTFDLFVELGATDEQLDFPYIYASGLGGFATKTVDGPRENMRPLYELIVEKCPSPDGELTAPFYMQAEGMSYNDFVGRQALGRVRSGSLKKGDRLFALDKDGARKEGSCVKLEGFDGLKRMEIDEATCGDIVIVSGFPEVMLGDTLTTDASGKPLDPIAIGEPAVSIDVSVNSGPLAGREGKNVTFSKIKDRLLKEKKANISLIIEEVSSGSEAMRVSGRGELHLSVLLEAMRRENFEFVVSEPHVIVKDIDGEKCEPIERVYIEVPDEYSGGVIQELSQRKGLMQHLEVTDQNIAKIEFLIPTRGLMGYRNDFLTATRGLGIMSSTFSSFEPWKGAIPKRKNGVLISMNSGQSSAYSLDTLQDRGVLFLGPGDEVYEGMIVGQNSRENDLVVNVTKSKQLTNFRTVNKDDAALLAPPRQFTLEQAIDFIGSDELVEVTPKSIRLRKKHLSEVERKRAKSSN
jgi:GTP-binding protein